MPIVIEEFTADVVPEAPAAGPAAPPPAGQAAEVVAALELIREREARLAVD